MSGAVGWGSNGAKAPPSTRQANRRLATGVRKSVPVKVNVALATWITPLGPLVICVSGGVLSTITTRVVAVAFVARSTVTAPRV